MHRTILQQMVAALILAVGLSACAAGRSVIDVMPPTTMVTNGMAVAKIVEVRDRRMFEAAPREPSTPSLQSAADISNPMITARALARKRGGYGNALGDIVLPEGRTVAGLVKGAMQKALQDKGYRVVEEGSPDYARAVPVSVDIQRFWAWFTPGAFAVTVECQSAVTFTGGAFTSASPPPVEGYAMASGFGAFESTWADVIKRALADLSEKMEAQIKSP